MGAELVEVAAARHLLGDLAERGDRGRVADRRPARRPASARRRARARHGPRLARTRRRRRARRGRLGREHAGELSPGAAACRRGGRDPLELLGQRHRCKHSRWREAASPRTRAARDALRAARPDLRPLRAAALVRTGPALAALPRLADRGRRRGHACSTSPPARAPSRSSSSAATGCSVVGLDQSPEMLAAARAESRALAATSGLRLVEGRAEELPFEDGDVRRADVHVPAALRRRPGGDAARSSRASSARAARSRSLEFGVPPRRLARAAWELYVRRRAARSPGRSISPGWHEVGGFLGAEHPRASTATAARAPARALARGGRRGRARAAAQPRRRGRRLGPARVSAEARPAFYALAPGGWRDYVTLLHPPYTLWHLSLRRDRRRARPAVRRGRGSALALLRVLARARASARTRSTSCTAGRCRRGSRARTLVALAAVSIAGAAAIGIGARDRLDARGCSPFVAFGRVHRRRLQPRAARRRFHADALVRARVGRVPALTAYFAAAERAARRGGARGGLRLRCSASRSGGSRRRCGRVRRASRRSTGRSSTTTARSSRSTPRRCSRAPEARCSALAAATAALALALRSPARVGWPRRDVAERVVQAVFARSSRCRGRARSRRRSAARPARAAPGRRDGVRRRRLAAWVAFALDPSAGARAGRGRADRCALSPSRRASSLVRARRARQRVEAELGGPENRLARLSSAGDERRAQELEQHARTRPRRSLSLLAEEERRIARRAPQRARRARAAGGARSSPRRSPSPAAGRTAPRGVGRGPRARAAAASGRSISARERQRTADRGGRGADRRRRRAASSRAARSSARRSRASGRSCRGRRAVVRVRQAPSSRRTRPSGAARYTSSASGCAGASASSASRSSARRPRRLSASERASRTSSGARSSSSSASSTAPRALRRGRGAAVRSAIKSAREDAADGLSRELDRAVETFAREAETCSRSGSRRSATRRRSGSRAAQRERGRVERSATSSSPHSSSGSPTRRASSAGGSRSSRARREAERGVLESAALQELHAASTRRSRTPESRSRS